MDSSTRKKAIKDATVGGVFSAGAYAGNLNQVEQERKIKRARILIPDDSPRSPEVPAQGQSLKDRVLSFKEMILNPPPPPKYTPEEIKRIKEAVAEIDAEKKIGYVDVKHQMATTTQRDAELDSATLHYTAIGNALAEGRISIEEYEEAREQAKENLRQGKKVGETELEEVGNSWYGQNLAGPFLESSDAYPSIMATSKIKIYSNKSRRTSISNYGPNWAQRAWNWVGSQLNLHPKTVRTVSNKLASSQNQVDDALRGLNLDDLDRPITNPSAVSNAAARGVLRNSVKPSAMGLTSVISVGTNLYDYTWGEHEDIGVNSSEFAASTVVDTGVGIGLGLLAAGVVAIGIAAFGLPIALAGGATLLVGLGLGVAFNALDPVIGSAVTGQSGINITEVWKNTLAERGKSLPFWMNK